jgi:hypothetical protein
MLLLPSEKSERYNVMCSCKKHRPRREKMIENGLILTGSEADLLSRALAEVKTKVYEESETSLDDTQALDALREFGNSAD